MTAPISLTEAAASRVQQLITAQNNPALMLRLQVNGGGCSGFSYKFDLDQSREDDDEVYEFHGVKLVVDDASRSLLDGAVVDYRDDLMASAFVVENPNASSTCGCGTSFSI